MKRQYIILFTAFLFAGCSSMPLSEDIRIIRSKYPEPPPIKEVKLLTEQDKAYYEYMFGMKNFDRPNFIEISTKWLKNHKIYKVTQGARFFPKIPIIMAKDINSDFGLILTLDMQAVNLVLAKEHIDWNALNDAEITKRITDIFEWERNRYKHFAVLSKFEDIPYYNHFEDAKRKKMAENKFKNIIKPVKITKENGQITMELFLLISDDLYKRKVLIKSSHISYTDSLIHSEIAAPALRR